MICIQIWVEYFEVQTSKEKKMIVKYSEGSDNHRAESPIESMHIERLKQSHL